MKLKYDRKNVYYSMTKEEKKEIFDFCEGYKTFLDNGKTEREAVIYAIDLLKQRGYTPLKMDTTICMGEKMYYVNRGKQLFVFRAGTTNIAENGIRILATHIDSPRLDIKQVPLYEKNDIAYLKTHYYGGIKKYHWLAMPLSLHGVVALSNGKLIDISIGDEDDEPVFYITDLLPHLSRDLDVKPIGEGFSAENLNIIVGSIPAEEKEGDAVKLAVLQILHEKYGLTEEDFLSAELEAVPASSARDVGFDRGLIIGYGQDDKACAYSALLSIVETNTKQSVLGIFTDKEEIGSVGATAMQSEVVKDIFKLIAKSFDIDEAVIRSNSKCISADATAAFDSNFSGVFDELNSAFINHGICINKYNGARGKFGSNDSSAEFIAWLRNIFCEAGVIWQTGELGKVDMGGGSTIAKFISQLNIDTIDIGIPILSMHAPYELSSKADIYSAFKAFSEFLKK